MLIRVVEPGELETRREDLDDVLIDPDTRQARRASDPPFPAPWHAGGIRLSALVARPEHRRPEAGRDRPMTPEDKARPWWVRVRLSWWRRGRYPTRAQMFALTLAATDLPGVAVQWLHRENIRFGGRTPWSMYEAGDGWAVVDLLLWLGETS